MPPFPPPPGMVPPFPPPGVTPPFPPSMSPPVMSGSTPVPTLVICHASAGLSAADGAAPAHVARSITRANEPGIEEEDGTQVPRAQFFTSKFRRYFL